MTSRLLTSALALACLLPALAAVPATANDLSSTISCLRGNVPGADYAELGQRLQEYATDRRGGVSLVSSIGGVGLRVVDTAGNSVCQEEANNSTSCTFRIDLALIDEFNIIVDNVQNPDEITYKICAY